MANGTATPADLTEISAELTGIANNLAALGYYFDTDEQVELSNKAINSTLWSIRAHIDRIVKDIDAM